MYLIYLISYSPSTWWFVLFSASATILYPTMQLTTRRPASRLISIPLSFSILSFCRVSPIITFPQVNSINSTNKEEPNSLHENPCELIHISSLHNWLEESMIVPIFRSNFLTLIFFSQNDSYSWTRIFAFWLIDIIFYEVENYYDKAKPGLWYL